MGFGGFGNDRNGLDDLARVCMFIALVFLVLSFFFGTVFWIVAAIFLGYGYFRVFSRNVTKRYEENQQFLEGWDRFLGFFRIGFKRIKDKDHRYYRCPRCKRTLRVPKGKGRISIHCPTCGTDFVKNT